MDRRNFLSTSMQLFLSTVALSACSTSMPVYRSEGRGKVFIALEKGEKTSTIRILDLDDRSYKDFEVPVRLPHSIMINPKKTDELFVFEFLGAAAILNLSSGESRRVDNEKGYLFGGHAILSPETGTVWSTELHLDKKSVVRARSLNDLSLVSGPGTSIIGGHHVVRLPGTDTIVTGGLNWDSSERYITFYDQKNRNAIQNIRTSHVTGHLLPISSTEVVGVVNVVNMSSQEAEALSSMVRNNQHPSVLTHELDISSPAPLFYANTRGEFHSFWDESRKNDFRFGFGLDTLPSSNGLYLSGHQNSDTVIVWKRFEIQKVISVPQPYGIMSTRDGSQFLVLSAGTIKVFSSSTFEQEDEITFERPIALLSRYT